MVSEHPHARGGRDTRPWYRYFWPWFIIALPASVVVAGISTLMIAIAHEDSLVVDDYYRQGLGINRVLAADEAARQLQLSARLSMNAQSGAVKLQVQGAEPITDADVTLRLIHPTDSDRDVTLTLNKSGGGYRGMLDAEVQGRRYMQIEGTSPRPWLLRKEVEIPEGAAMQWQLRADN